jgi:hypothetical protein
MEMTDDAERKSSATPAKPGGATMGICECSEAVPSNRAGARCSDLFSITTPLVREDRRHPSQDRRGAEGETQPVRSLQQRLSDRTGWVSPKVNSAGVVLASPFISLKVVTLNSMIHRQATCRAIVRTAGASVRKPRSGRQLREPSVVRMANRPQGLSDDCSHRKEGFAELAGGVEVALWPCRTIGESSDGSPARLTVSREGRGGCGSDSLPS